MDEGDEGAGLVGDFRSIMGIWCLVRMPACFKTLRRASTPALPGSINKSTSCVVRTCFQKDNERPPINACEQEVGSRVA